MNTQNILKNYGSFFDLKLDSSEYYDYEIAKTDKDYNSDVLNFNVDINYDTLKVQGTLDGFSCLRDTITLTEIDLTLEIEDYEYRNITLTLPYDDFVNHFNTDLYNFNEMLLNNQVFMLIFEEKEHYFSITQFNEPLFIDNQLILLTNEEIIDLFDGGFYDCAGNLTDVPCCIIPDKLNTKYWAYRFKNVDCDDVISQRNPKGWSFEMVFNRDSREWVDGSVFYYIGTRGTKELKEFADNNLTFSFTADGKIKWETIRYNTFCDEEGVLVEEYIKHEGITPELCVQDNNRDFVITATFERDKYYFDCDLENQGGVNDLKIHYGRGPTPPDLIRPDCSAWRRSIWSGVPVEEILEEEYNFDEFKEELSDKWVRERNRRMGTLKIYLNGRPIYKNSEFEEIIPSSRGQQPFIQSWGGNISSFDIESGISCFNIKLFKYYEEPLHFINVRHNVIRLSNIYDIEFCGTDCVDDIVSLN